MKGSFDLKRTKSGVGFLGNFIMKNLNFERSEHPLFSFIAIGKNKKIVKNIGISAFGKDSVHQRLYKKNASFLNFFRPFFIADLILANFLTNLILVSFNPNKSSVTKT